MGYLTRSHGGCCKTRLLLVVSTPNEDEDLIMIADTEASGLFLSQRLLPPSFVAPPLAQ